MPIYLEKFEFGLQNTAIEAIISQRKNPSHPPYCVRDMGEDNWPSELWYVQAGLLWLSRCARRGSWIQHQPRGPPGQWTCSQGVQSLNLGTFQCFTWFKTKNLVKVHCSKWKIPSNKVVQTPYLLFCWVVLLTPAWTFIDLIVKVKYIFYLNCLRHQIKW